MLELHRRVSPKETLVGWYSTVATGVGAAAAAKKTDDFTIVVHEFFCDASGPGISPIHLLVDVSLRTQNVGIFAHRSVSNALLKK